VSKREVLAMAGVEEPEKWKEGVEEVQQMFTKRLALQSGPGRGVLKSESP
jgi:hypothetical protein